MWPRLVFPSASFILAVLAVALGTAADGGDGRRAAVNRPLEQVFPTDFRTLYDCVESVARDRGVATEIVGSSVWWGPSSFKNPMRERFAVVAEVQSVPFRGDGLMSHIAYLGSDADNRSALELRTIRLDLDTGELRGPGGVDLSRLRVRRVGVNITLTNQDHEELYEINIHKDFTQKQLTVSISSNLEDGPTLSRDFLKSLESRIRLASKLSEIRKRRIGEKKDHN